MKSASQSPSISIVIPSFNQGQFIQQTIDSILDQDYPLIEVVVIDGGSTDDTVSILKSYDEKIQWISEKDNGQTHAINKGFTMCSGEICGYLNSDDYLMPGSLETLGNAFSDPSVHWLIGNYRIINEIGKPIHRPVLLYKRFLRSFSSYPLLLVMNYINQPSTYRRRSLMNEVGKMDEDLDYGMDYEYWLRFYQITKPKRISSILSVFRIHHASKGGSRYVEQFAEELEIVRRYTKNRLLLWLHRFHNVLIVNIYKLVK